MDISPLDCHVCGKELISPCLLPCLHSVCASCPPCCATSNISPSSGRCSPDRLAEFLIETSHEAAEICANCEQIKQPMYFCETCQQALCHECRNVVHQARMFATHQVVVAAESACVRGRVACTLHSEPYILYCTEQKSLSCIQCFNERSPEDRHHFVSVSAGHKICTEKIEKWATKLRLYQVRMSQYFHENPSNLNNIDNFDLYDVRLLSRYHFSLYQLCQQIQDTVLSTRDRLAQELEQAYKTAEETCRQQVEEIFSIMGPIRLCLMSAQILCSSASPIDVLQLSGELSKRSIVTRSIDKLPPIHVIDSIEARTEIAKALEPFLGLSAAWCLPSLEGSGSMKSYKTRSGQLGDRVQEAQRDLTMRRCLIGKQIFLYSCSGVETRLGLHSAVLNDLQPELQEMWQEQLDRVRRQQIIYREKVEECLTMRETARLVLTAAKQLLPYATCIESMSTLIDPKRCHPPDPAPMESICMQITGIEPNSETRIQAIEKEEQNRRAVQEAKKREELAERGTPVKGLKHGKAKRKDTYRMLVNTNRERSPGGTDSTLISPCLIKRMYINDCFFICSTQEEMDKCFELLNEQSEYMKFTREKRKKKLSFCSQSTTFLPSLDQLLGRIPLASRVTADVGMSHQSMLQSLHDVFAVQKPDSETAICEEPNVSASAVKAFTQKVNALSSPVRRIEPPLLSENPETPRKSRKERRRRKKRSDESLPDEHIADIAIASVPVVPYVPKAVFSDSEMPPKQLGSFEAKEKMLRSLREKMGSPKNEHISCSS
uniref:B box-type domain-containing protein n=1 Tax=Angiostrongylus cantonensis TaxID=6313 RepID=A0A158PCM8_ANGCA